MAQPPTSPAPAPAPAHLGARPSVGSRSRAGELILQLVIVTVGVLIVLLLESLVQWSRHRALAGQARANIREEIRENVRRLDRFFEGSRQFSEQREQVHS
jgi:ABC-type transport system involved in cytochrome bd biosynthesis fused ATPase/permease subunit